MDQTIRIATPNDLPAIHSIFKDWEEEACTYGLVADTIEELHERISDYFLVLELDNKIGGFVIAEVETGGCVFSDKGKYLTIQDFYVAPTFRGSNYGTLIIDAVMKKARNNGTHKFSVYSGNKDWQRIFSYYQKFGFKMWCIQLFAEDSDSRDV